MPGLGRRPHPSAIGLANPGAGRSAAAGPGQRLPGWRPWACRSSPASSPAPPEEFGTVAGIVAQAAPDMVEVNISCPNVHSSSASPTPRAPTPRPRSPGMWSARCARRAFPSS
ncbi:MAG: hypothetical protein R2854_07085 [Caldilineaceae bacterium]